MNGTHPERKKNMTKTVEGLESSYISQLQNIHHIELIKSYYCPEVVIKARTIKSYFWGNYLRFP